MSANNKHYLTNNEQYALIGKVAILLTYSPIHRHFSMMDLRDIILPAVHLNQYRVYENADKEAVGFVAWGFFSPEVEKKFIAGTSVLTHEEWHSGERIYITDFITQGEGVVRQIVHDLKVNVFADSVAYALRFDQPGKPRGSISKFLGKNVKRSKEKANTANYVSTGFHNVKDGAMRGEAVT